MSAAPAAATSRWWSEANPAALRYVKEHALEPLAWEDLRARLEYLSEPPSFPLGAVRIAQAAWPAYTDHFRETFAAEMEGGDVEEERRSLHILAGYLLAEHRDPDCFIHLQRLLTSSEMELQRLLGFEWTETMAAWAATFCCTRPEHMDWLANVARDREAWAHQRLAAASALVRCADVYSVERVRQALLDALESFAAFGCRIDEGDLGDPPSMMGLLLCELMDAGVPQHAAPAIEAWFARRLVDRSVVTLDDLRYEMAGNRKGPRPTLPGCTVKEIGWWAWFKPDEPPPARAPLAREAAKIGRNDPCSCGSGRKYKKCCGA